jgi:hypothetical protein
MERIAKGVLGVKGKGVASNRGIVQRFEMELPKNTSPDSIALLGDIKDHLSKLCSPLPEEAVGMGAKWKVVQPGVFIDVTLQTTSSYRIVEIDRKGFRITLDMLRQSKKIETKVSKDFVPPFKTTCDSTDATVQGISHFSVTSMLPIQSNLSHESVVSITHTREDQSQQFVTKTATEVTVNSISE